ncbi:MAG: hypothetical protein ACE5FP_02510 [Gemmatimonadota bacterium]
MIAPPRFTPVDVDDSHLSFSVNGERHDFARVLLPDPFMEWLVEGRRAMYDLLEGKGTAPFFASHLPVVVTKNRQSPTPFNTGNKGVGVLPVDEHLTSYCDTLQGVLEDTRGAPVADTLARRLNAVRQPLDAGHISNRALITLEIFERNTFQNLSEFPLATLHYTDQGPVYLSFQIDAVVEILPPGHPAYRFAFLSRQLFEHDPFHITQTRFPYAYLFHPIGVKDKTPKHRH